jgi:methylase of polypeptide subunit release factors
VRVWNDAIQRSPRLTRALLGVRVPGDVRQVHWDPATLRLARAMGDVRGRRVLDVGCGDAGTLGVLAALRGASAVVSDVRDAAVASAVRVGEANGVRVEGRVADLLDAVRPGERFDLVVFNPPWIPTRVGFARGFHRRMPGREVWDGGEDGGETVRRFVLQARELPPETRVLIAFSARWLAAREVWPGARVRRGRVGLGVVVER